MSEPKEMFSLPDNSVTEDAGYAAEEWAGAFYQAKDLIRGLLSLPIRFIRCSTSKKLEHILADCDSVLELGED